MVTPRTWSEHCRKLAFDDATAVLPVDRIDGRGLYPDQDFALTRLRPLDIFELEHVRASSGAYHDGPHRASPACRTSRLYMDLIVRVAVFRRIVGLPRSEPKCFVAHRYIGSVAGPE